MLTDIAPLAEETHVILKPDSPEALGAARAMLDRHVPGALGTGWAMPLSDGSWVLNAPTIDRLGDSAEIEAVAEELQAIAEMASVEVLDGTKMAVRLATTDAPPPLEAAEVRPAPPRTQLWQRRAIRADEAIALARDGDADYAAIRVALIDTGATNHPELTADDPAESTRILWDDGHGFFNHQTADDRLDYKGTPGHGTRVMSVISSPPCGTVPGLSIVPLRSVTSSVFDVLPLLPSRVPPAMRFASGEALGSGKAMAPADIVNISLGDPFVPSVSLCRAIDACYENGILVVAAAGNIIRRVVYPARFSRTIAAGGAAPSSDATGRDNPSNLRPWNGASRGRAVTVSAPADRITRLNVRRNSKRAPLSFESGAEMGSGTSYYAAAMVSAAAALWIALHRERVDALRAGGEAWKVVEAFRAALVSTALVPDNWDSANYGAGILDMAALVGFPFDDALRGVTRQTAAVEEG